MLSTSQNVPCKLLISLKLVTLKGVATKALRLFLLLERPWFLSPGSVALVYRLLFYDVEYSWRRELKDTQMSHDFESSPIRYQNFEGRKYFPTVLNCNNHISLTVIMYLPPDYVPPPPPPHTHTLYTPPSSVIAVGGRLSRV